MHFEIHGPFDLERNHKSLIDNSAESKREFWDYVDEVELKLPKACGCYVFAVKASRGTLPWYVGKAEKRSFDRECLSAHKINHFNNVVAGRKGIPVLFLLPQVTKNGTFRKPTKSKRPAISALESLLIGMAMSRNRRMVNIKGTKMARNLQVEGFLNTPRRAKGGPAGHLRKVLEG